MGNKPPQIADRYNKAGRSVVPGAVFEFEVAGEWELGSVHSLDSSHTVLMFSAWGPSRKPTLASRGVPTAIQFADAEELQRRLRIPRGALTAPAGGFGKEGESAGQSIAELRAAKVAKQEAAAQFPKYTIPARIKLRGIRCTVFCQADEVGRSSGRRKALASIEVALHYETDTFRALTVAVVKKLGDIVASPSGEGRWSVTRLADSTGKAVEADARVNTVPRAAMLRMTARCHRDDAVLVQGPAFTGASLSGGEGGGGDGEGSGDGKRQEDGGGDEEQEEMVTEECEVFEHQVRLLFPISVVLRGDVWCLDCIRVIGRWRAVSVRYRGECGSWQWMVCVQEVYVGGKLVSDHSRRLIPSC